MDSHYKSYPKIEFNIYGTDEYEYTIAVWVDGKIRYTEHITKGIFSEYRIKRRLAKLERLLKLEYPNLNNECLKIIYD